MRKIKKKEKGMKCHTFEEFSLKENAMVLTSKRENLNDS
jgi:hypothetical protein